MWEFDEFYTFLFSISFAYLIFLVQRCSVIYNHRHFVRAFVHWVTLFNSKFQVIHTVVYNESDGKFLVNCQGLLLE